jgi:tetratricopeptide (TPR) repeat protein
MSKEFDDYMRKFMQGPEISETIKDGLNQLLTSHLASGQEYERKGMLEEAIVEYAKEYDRPIKSGIDAEIVQKAYCQTGEVYRKLGKVAEALKYLQKARGLLAIHGVGTVPHMYLAELYMEQGQIDEAIEVYEEYVEKWPQNNAMKQLLLKAREKRDSDENHTS